MRFCAMFLCCMMLVACCTTPEIDEDVYYAPRYYETQYEPVYSGKVFHVAGFGIKEGQQMRDFFDEFEEPMHAKYTGNDTVVWTYYIDYNRASGKGDIVRFYDLKNYGPKSLCALRVTFYMTYVKSATTNCR